MVSLGVHLLWGLQGKSLFHLSFGDFGSRWLLAALLLSSQGILPLVFFLLVYSHQSLATGHILIQCSPILTFDIIRDFSRYADLGSFE